MFKPYRALSAITVLALAACASTPAPVTITETLARTPNLSTLNKLVNDAGLADTLKGQGPFTVFAPSDDAFKAVPAKTLEDIAKDPARLKAVLTYHVVAGKLGAADVKNMTVKSVQGADLALSKAGEFVTVEDAAVQQTDVAATNGVIHIVDRVLVPPRR